MSFLPTNYPGLIHTIEDKPRRFCSLRRSWIWHRVVEAGCLEYIGPVWLDDKTISRDPDYSSERQITSREICRSTGSCCLPLHVPRISRFLNSGSGGGRSFKNSSGLCFTIFSVGFRRGGHGELNETRCVGDESREVE